MPYGSLGYLSSWTNPQDFANLPEWLRRQIVPTSQDESTTTYGFGQGLFDQSGRQVSQLSPNAFSQGADGSLIDPNARWHDEALGDVTGTENLNHVQSASFRNGLLATQLAIAAATGYGAYSAMGGAGAAAGADGAAGLGGAANPFAGAAAEGALSSPGLLGAAGTAGGAVPMGQISVTAPSLAGGMGAGEAGGLLGGLGTAANALTPDGNPFEGSQAEGEVSGPGLLDSLVDQFQRNPLQLSLIHI